MQKDLDVVIFDELRCFCGGIRCATLRAGIGVRTRLGTRNVIDGLGVEDYITWKTHCRQ